MRKALKNSVVSIVGARREPEKRPDVPYRLVFVTSGTTLASSSNIGYYNNFVTNAANAVPDLAKLNATWTVIGSTGTTNAITNIGASLATVGIYDLTGTLVANGTSGLFSGSLLAPIDTTELGQTAPVLDPNFPGYVWTGSTENGRKGADPLGTGSSGNIGLDTATSSQWIYYGYLSGQAESTVPLPVYAISSEINTVPEPGTTGLTVLGGTILLLAGRRKAQART